MIDVRADRTVATGRNNEFELATALGSQTLALQWVYRNYDNDRLHLNAQSAIAEPLRNLFVFATTETIGWGPPRTHAVDNRTNRTT